MEVEMSENQSNEPDLGDELRNLGKNLSDFLRAAWASEERRQVQKDVESSLNDLGATINKAANEFSSSDTGQRLKASFEDIRQRVETSEVQTRARKEFVEALKKANAELTKAANKWGQASSDQGSSNLDNTQS
jgi:hypothetical protein